MAAGSNYGELVLVLGDLHIPHRAADIPPAFRKILVPGKMSAVLFTGNACTRAQLDFLRTLAPRVYAVRGDMDDGDGGAAGALPASLTATIGGVRVGLANGSTVVPRGDADALAALARRLDCDVLVTGATHAHSVVEYERRCYVNPGSATGAYSPLAAGAQPPVPSFTLMSIQEGGRIEFFVYELGADGKLNISRSAFSKHEAQAQGQAHGTSAASAAQAALAADAAPRDAIAAAVGDDGL